PRLDVRQGPYRSAGGNPGSSELVLPAVPRGEGREVGGVLPRPARSPFTGGGEKAGERPGGEVAAARAGAGLQGGGDGGHTAAGAAAGHLPEVYLRHPVHRAERSSPVFDGLLETSRYKKVYFPIFHPVEKCPAPG